LHGERRTLAIDPATRGFEVESSQSTVSASASVAEEAMRKASRESRTFSTPAAAAPTTMRVTWLRLSSIVEVPARANKRRASRPECGLTMMPSVP